MKLKRYGGVAAMVALTAAMLTAPAASAAADPLLQAGVHVYGDSSWLFQPCVSLGCGVDAGTWSNYEDGGPGVASATVTGGGGLTPQLAFFASARLVDDLALPVLRAFAAGWTEIGPHPDFSVDCCWLTESTASARGVQYYTYTGDEEDYLYELTYTLDGIVGAGEFGNISGGISLFDGDPSVGFELPLGNVVASDQVTVSGDPGGKFVKEGSVSLMLNPGQGFYASVFLHANIARPGIGAADASHTLTTTFTRGDPSFLTPSLPPSVAQVPEPSAVGLLLLGAPLMVRRWRRGNRRA